MQKDLDEVCIGLYLLHWFAMELNTNNDPFAKGKLWCQYPGFFRAIFVPARLIDLKPAGICRYAHKMEYWWYCEWGIVELCRIILASALKEMNQIENMFDSDPGTNRISGNSTTFHAKKHMRFGQKDWEEHLGVWPRRWCHGLFREWAVGQVDRILTPSHILNGIMGDGFSNYQLMVIPWWHLHDTKKKQQKCCKSFYLHFFWGHLKMTFQLSSCFPKVPLMCPCWPSTTVSLRWWPPTATLTWAVRILINASCSTSWRSSSHLVIMTRAILVVMVNAF